MTVARGPEHHGRDRQLEHVIVGPPLGNIVGMVHQAFHCQVVHHAGLDRLGRYRCQDRWRDQPMLNCDRQTIGCQSGT
jgi:hypothetical protein